MKPPCTSAGSDGAPSKRDNFDRVKQLVLSEETWDSWEMLASIQAPIAGFITKYDSQKGVVADVYTDMMLLTQKYTRVADFKHITPARLKQLQAIVQARWEYLHCPIHGVAALLSPRNWADPENDWSSLMTCVLARVFIFNFNLKRRAAIDKPKCLHIHI
jgi:hypothetical protein